MTVLLAVVGFGPPLRDELIAMNMPNFEGYIVLASNIVAGHVLDRLVLGSVYHSRRWKEQSYSVI